MKYSRRLIQVKLNGINAAENAGYQYDLDFPAGKARLRRSDQQGSGAQTALERSRSQNSTVVTRRLPKDKTHENDGPIGGNVVVQSDNTGFKQSLTTVKHVVSNRSPVSERKIGQAGEENLDFPVKRRRRGRQKRDRLDTYITHMRNCHIKGLTNAQRREEATKIANSRANLAERSRVTLTHELNVVGDPALGPFIDRLFEIASDLLEAETELCDIASRPAAERPRLQIIFVNRLCERALRASDGVSAAIAQFAKELAAVNERLKATREKIR